MNPAAQSTLKIRWLALLTGVLLALGPGIALAQTLSPRATVDWLKGLLLEARLGLRSGEGLSAPRLFTELLPDGRTWLEYIADSLGVAAGGDPTQPGVPNQWALLDEAVSVLLAEAEVMKQLAAARAGSPDEARFQNARLQYLRAAARILRSYQVTAAEVFDSTAGQLPNPLELSDWLLPGGIQLREISGAGRLNTETGAFAGRLSGVLVLPGFGATLAVPNASFDSFGGFDLTAHGALNFRGGQLAVPPRKPLRLRHTPGRGLSPEGDARLTLNNGLRFDASVALTDPVYCFGLAARGLELDLGRSLLVRVPTLSLEQVNAFDDAARAAFAEYFRSLNGTLETLLGTVTNFPPVDTSGFGQPPEFVAPALTFDFSGLNAWSAEILARTRAGLTNAQQDLQSVLDSLQRLNDQARALTNVLADERGRLANLAARMTLRRQMQQAAELAAQQQAAENADLTELTTRLLDGARQEGDLVVALLTPDLPDRLAESLEVASLLLEAEATLQSLGQTPTPPGTIPADPCAAYTNNAANYLQRAEALARCAARRQAARYGIDATNGAITNATRFNALSEVELDRTVRLLVHLESEFELQGADDQGEFLRLLTPVLNRQHELLLAELAQSAQRASLARLFELASLLVENAANRFHLGLEVHAAELSTQLEAAVGPRLAGLAPEVIDQARTEAQKALALRRRQIASDVDVILGRNRAIGVLAPGDPYQPDVLTQLSHFFRVLSLPVPPVVGSRLDDYVRFKVAELRARPFTVEFLADRLSEAEGLASLVIGLTDWTDLRLTNDFSTLTDLQLTLENFSVSLVGAAELQRAWWLLDRYQDAFRAHAVAYGSRVNEGLRAAEREARNAALLAAGRIAGALGDLVGNLVTPQDVLVPLPGNVAITHLHGRLCYDRAAGVLDGCFGGRVEFPEIGPNVFFEISQACLTSDGSYQIAAATAAPLPFGRMELTSSLNIAGTPAGVATFDGTGTLRLDTGSGLAAGPTLAVTVNYNAAEGELRLGSTLNQLRLSDDLALLDGTAAVSLATTHPQGALMLQGKLGLLARQPLPMDAPLSPTNFWLVIDTLPTTFTYTDHDVTAELTGGTLTLPPDLFTQDVPANAPPVTVGITGRLCLRYDFTRNQLEFCGPANEPFVLALQNLRLQLPALPGFVLTIQSANLELSGTQFPLLRNLAGNLALPLPGPDALDTNQTRRAVLSLNAQNWRIDGLPAAASISIGSAVRLVDYNGFALDVLAGAGLSLTNALVAGERRMSFTLAGALRGQFDGDLLFDAENDAAFGFETSGRFQWDVANLPTFELDAVTFAARLKLGGENGFELLGVTPQGIPDPDNPASRAAVTLTGLQNLFQLAPERPFEVLLSGALGSAEFVYFGLGNARFVFDGVANESNFEPAFSVQSLGFREGEQLKLLGQELLPLRLTAGSITFLDPARPLDRLFAPDNLQFTLSGEIDLSLASPEANAEGVPRLYGALDNVIVSLPDGFTGPPRFSVNTFVLTLENLSIGDLAGLTGGLAVGNLQNPSELFFAGTVGGGFNGVAIKATVATRLDGLIGLCLAVNAGPAGIPLDGGTLGGILLTGAQGGVSFANQFADPCDFQSYLGLAPDQAQEINQFIDQGLVAMRDLLASVSQLALAAAAGQGRTPLEALYEAAYAGVPCQDLTIQLKGTFSWTPIFAALSATGGAVVSTTGSAGILGSVNLFGIPVGTGEVFFSATDANGDPNPSLCGGGRVALGPLDLSRLDLALGCEDCVTGTLQALANFIAGLTGDVLTQASPILYTFVENAAGHRLANLRNMPLTAFFGPPGSGALLTQEEQVAVLAGLLNLPEVVKFLDANPEAVTEFNRDALTALGARTVGLLLEIYNRVEPRLAFCGEVEPKLFGFSLTGGNTLAAVRLYEDKTHLRGDVTFSPSYILGNLPFMILSSGSMANVVPALDEATLGFSLGLPLFNEQMFDLLANAPATFTEAQVDHLLANAVMTFGYELSPFGFKLADGEGRVALPTLQEHPDNPARRAARPGDYVDGRFVAPAFPDRVVILKAALDANVLAQAIWSGRGDDLVNLFPPGSPEAEALVGRELARDYFPYGGFLGASKVQLPKPITDAPPLEQLNALAAEDTELLERLTLALDLFHNYLLGSREIGELMLYVPFARPPELFWTAQQGPRALLATMAKVTPESLIAQGLDLYPTEQFFMRGAVHAQLLGLPIGAGELVADPAVGLFRLTASVPEGTWLRDFVQADLTFQIRSAQYILETDPTQLPAGVTAADLQPEARLQAVFESLQAAAQTGSDARKLAAVNEALARITDTLPKVSLESALNLQLPEGLSSVLQFNSGAGFYAFSPRFEPGYALPGYAGEILYPDPDPNNPGPYTLARRNGGVVAVGHFTFGFNLSDPDPGRRLVIDVPEAALAVTGASDPSLFPALAGRVRVDEIALPGVFAFNGAITPPFRFKNGLVQFDSAPPPNADLLAIEGALTPIDLGPFLSVRPLPAEANAENLLGGTLRVTRTVTGANYALSLNPAAVTVPLLGSSLQGMIYGEESRRGVFTPFTFSTVPGQPWNATLRLDGALEIRSPLDPGGPVVFRAQPLMVDGAPVPFLGEVTGFGLEEFELRVTIPNGLEFTLFPGTAHESRLTTGEESATCLFVASDGRIYFDSGTRTLDLNGLAEVTGRIEFGFEPVSRTPVLVHTPLAAFTAPPGRSQEQVMQVSNGNRAGGQLVVDASVNDAQNFSVLPNRLVLGPGETGQLRVRFTPSVAGNFTRQLSLANNSAQPLVLVPLTASAVAQPRLRVSLAAVDFGATPLGTTRSQAVRVSNLGDATLTLAGLQTATAPFAVDRTSLTVPAGQSRDVIIRFTPASTASVTDKLTFNSNDPAASFGSVELSGRGSNRFWYRQRRGGGLDSLRAIAVTANSAGFAAGPAGAFLRGQAGGRAWTDDFFRGGHDFRGIVFPNATTGWLVGGKGVVFKTTNGGATWLRQTAGELDAAAFNWRTVAVLDPASGAVALAGEENGFGRIVFSPNATSFEVGGLPDKTPPLSGLAFGTTDVGVAVGEQGTILRTADGGKTWQRIKPPAGAEGAHLRGVAVNETSTGNYVIVGDDGLILRSTDAGLSWAIRASGTTADLHAVVRGGSAFYAVGDAGVIRRSSVSGLSWVAEDAQTTTNFRGLASNAGQVWAASAHGDIFHRLTSPISGPMAVVTASDLNFGEIGAGGRVVGEVWVANEGTASLTLRLRASDGRFVVTPADQQSLAPGGRVLFTVTFDGVNGGSFGANFDLASDDDTTAKLGFAMTATVRKPDFTPLAYAALPAVLDLGDVVLGATTKTGVALENLGQAPLNLHTVTVRTDDVTARYEVKAGFTGAIAPGRSGSLDIEFIPGRVGLHRAQLEVASDARNGVAQVELIARVVEAPQVVLLDSTPRGVSVQVNGAALPLPAAFTIVDGTPGAGQLSVVANPLQGRLAVELPRTWLYSDGSPQLWNDNTIELPGFSFDASSFAVRIPLPAVAFAGFDIAAREGADADNYFEFARSGNNSRVTLRSEQDLVLGELKLGFEVSNAGVLSGQLSGRLGPEGPPPLDLVSDRVSILYDNSASPEFVLNRFFFGVGCRLSFGSGLPVGQACVLTPNPDKPIEAWDKAVCVP